MDLNNLELWQLLGFGIGGLFVVLGGLAANVWAGTKLVEQIKRLWAAVKVNKETLYKLVDEPTDTIPVGVAALTPWRDTPEAVSAMAKAIAEVVLQYQPPAREVVLKASASDLAKAVQDELATDLKNASRYSPQAQALIDAMARESEGDEAA